MCQQQDTSSNSRMAPEPRADSRGLPAAPAASAPLTFLGGVLFRLPLVLKAYSRLWDKNTRDRYLTSHQDDPSELTHTENKVFSNVGLGRCVCPRMSLQRPEEDVDGLLYHCQPCSLETGYLTEPRARLAVNQFQQSSCSPPPHSNTEPGLCGYAVIQTQALKLAVTSEPSPQPHVFGFLFVNTGSHSDPG